MKNEPEKCQEQRWCIPSNCFLVRKGDSWYIELVAGYFIPILSDEGIRLAVHLDIYYEREWQRELAERKNQVD